MKAKGEVVGQIVSHHEVANTFMIEFFDIASAVVAGSGDGKEERVGRRREAAAIGEDGMDWSIGARQGAGRRLESQGNLRSNHEA